jgi:long-chain acyl-CoA synthetase
MNFAMLLDMAADAFGERIAVTCGGDHLRYGGLREAARTAGARAKAFRHLALLDSNGLIGPLALFAAAYAGVPFVPLNYRLTAGELVQLLKRIAPAWLVAAPAHLEHLSLPPRIECADYAALLACRAAPAVAEPPESEGAVAVQLFTSGTTGQPKAALLRHENLLAYILGTVEFGSAAAEEATLVAVPPYHIAGISAVLSSTYAGRRVVMLPAFDPAEWLRVARSEHVTQAFVVPTMLVRIMEHLAGQGGSVALPALRAIAYGGGRMPLQVIERALELFPGVDFTNAYGLTETSATICLLDPADHRAARASSDSRVRQRLSSVGRPLPTVELEVRDTQGRAQPAGQPGVLFVRGAQVGGEYREAGSQLDRDGWFATQDRAWIDSAGYVFLDGRADDVIVRGGENISPGEIEEALLAHAAVADAVVLAVPSEQWGETVAAVIVLRPQAAATAAALQQWVRERLRSSRVPERIVFRAELPYNEMGKVLRRALREELERT